MNKFSDFNIQTNKNNYKGDKIKTERILNREITVHEYWIVDSTKQAGTLRLDMQISINGTYHILFTSSKGLMEAIAMVPKDKFPFETTIIRDNDWFRFT